MKKTILTFGIISGLISAILMLSTVPFLHGIDSDHGALIGYTAMVLSFLLVYFGIRSYRDNTGQGQITFAKAFAIGISITLISCVFYVATWEILYFTTLHGSMDKYFANQLAKANATQAQQIQHYKAMYENPLFNSAITFLEPLPVGLIITVLSAALLRRKPQNPTAEISLPATM